MDEILKLVQKRNQERKELTEQDIKRICHIMIQGKRYEEYVEEVMYENECSGDLDTAGKYDGSNLYFYQEGLDRFIMTNYDALPKNLDGTKVDFINFFTLVIIFHEFAHVRQTVMSNFKLNKESQLYAFNDKLHNIKDFYSDNYKIDLTEVNAWALGFLNACEFYHHMPKEIVTPFDMRIYMYYTISKILSSYTVDVEKEKIVAPAESLIIKASDYNLDKIGFNKDKFIDLIYSGENLSLYRQLCMGLPISFDSYAYVNLLGRCNNEGDNINLVKKLQHHR